MPDIFQHLPSGPWLAALVVLGLLALALWIVAIRTILRSPKFLRKALWILLTFFTFGFTWRTGGVSISIGLPFGALYVLWFARWGASPTAAEIAARQRAMTPVTAERHTVLAIHGAYGLLLAAFAVQMLWAIFGPLMPAMLKGVADNDPFLGAFRLSMGVFGALCLAGFTFLAFRPYPLAKLLCGLCAFAWTGHALMSLFIMPMVLGASFPATMHAAVVGGCGLVAAGCGIAHHLLDRRMTGPWLRAA